MDNREALDDWFETPAGQAFWSRERALVERFLTDCFGHHGIEVGTPSEVPLLLTNCTLGHRVRLSLGSDGTLSGGFRGHLPGLALRPRSVAAAVLIHVVDYHPAPGAVLAAVEQALAPGALLVVTAFNPASPTILKSQMVGDADWAPPNRCGAMRCRRWLEGLHLEAGSPAFTLAGAWPEGSARERLARLMPLGTGYVIAARKRERQRLAIPMGSRLSRRLAGPGLPRPTNRSMEDTAA